MQDAAKLVMASGSGSGQVRCRAFQHMSNGRESWDENLVPVRNSFPEAVNCLCTSRWFQSMTDLGKNEFRNNTELHCMGLKHLLLLVDCLSVIFWVIQSVNCFDLIWRLFRIWVK